MLLMGMATETIELTGHIVDSLLLAKVLDTIVDAGIAYELADVVRQLFLHYTETPTEVQVKPLDEADASPESLADTADAPAAQESADDAPAPDRPAEGEGSGEQEVPGIPNAELEPEGSAASEREPSPADPAEVEAARQSATPSSPGAAGGTTEAGDGGPEVAEGPTGAGPGRVADAPESVTADPTPAAERPEPAPLEADATDVVAGDATVPDPDESAST